MPAARHLVLLVEEPSMEAFLQALLPRVLPQGCSFQVRAFQGKDDLLAKLESRLRAYAQYLPSDWRLIVVVDRDDEDCQALKARLNALSDRAGLLSRSQAVAAGAADWQVAHRIAVEELEAWYFGDWQAVQAAYPRVSPGIPRGRGFRDPDAIAGGTWEAFERVLQRHGYFKAGLAKIQAARELGRHLEPARQRSPSFQAFHAALIDACAEPVQQQA
ncbi:DUF4276 family protein [Ideonella sp. 4Y16]|uniref:DUF4276 family protein n=1 Tax=Ideonella alba TaxID=2824118 RepID=UPI001B37175E|nr:DUF4276 family protein [Ideonella alba]MBQ0942239.1 DUF4276 family protein [Ideonella alba]